MEAVFLQNLSMDEEHEIQKFLSSLRFCSVLQHPGWNRAIHKAKTVRYYLARNDGRILCFALIVEGFLEAKIAFGPCGTQAAVIADSVEKIVEHYNARGFATLEIQLGMPISQHSEEIEYAIGKKLPFSQKVSRENWTTMDVLLNREADTLLSSFSQNHRRSIAKAVKNGLQAVVLQDEASVREFARLYDAMYRHRKQIPPFADSKAVFLEIYGLFQTELKGLFMGVFAQDSRMLGGACFTICNNTIAYAFGCTATGKQLPVLHLAFFEAMKIAANHQVERMDMGGINLMVDESDQVFHINRFKMGFNGLVVYYPKKMVFTLSAYKKLLLGIAKRLYYLWKKI
ncbi:MAG TPA: hypothetical protein VLH61_07685 [Bacteroidales bacterium]|nr:hypothetical protein [Bacteroidales bacterium]